MKHLKPSLISAFGLILILTSCAPQPLNFTPVHPLEYQLRSYDTCAVQVETSVVDTEKERQSLEKKLVKQLQRSNLFEQVVLMKNDPDLQSGLKVTTMITALKKTGFGGALLGASAGAAVRITFFDLDYDEIIGVYDYQFAPEGDYTLGSGAATGTVLQMIVLKIVRFINENYTP